MGEARAQRLGPVDLAAQAVDLGPAGDARRQAVARGVAVDHAHEGLAGARAGVERVRARPDQRQLARQHVEELRQLVDRAAPQHAPDPCHAGVVARDRAPRLGVGVGVAQAAELPHLHDAVVVAVPALAEQHGAGTLEPHRDRRGDHHRRQQHEGQAGEGGVEGALGEPPGRREAGRAGAEQPEAAPVAKGVVVAEGGQADVDGQHAQPVQEPVDARLRRQRQRDDDHVDLGAAHEGHELVVAAELRHREDLPRRAVVVAVVEEPVHRDVAVGPGGEAADQLGGARAAAGEHHAALHEPGLQSPGDRHREARAQGQQRGEQRRGRGARDRPSLRPDQRRGAGQGGEPGVQRARAGRAQPARPVAARGRTEAGGQGREGDRHEGRRARVEARAPGAVLGEPQRHRERRQVERHGRAGDPERRQRRPAQPLGQPRRPLAEPRGPEPPIRHRCPPRSRAPRAPYDGDPESPLKRAPWGPCGRGRRVGPKGSVRPRRPCDHPPATGSTPAPAPGPRPPGLPRGSERAGPVVAAAAPATPSGASRPPSRPPARAGRRGAAGIAGAVARSAPAPSRRGGPLRARRPSPCRAARRRGSRRGRRRPPPPRGA